MANESWQCFERGSPVDLDVFVARLVPGHPVRLILKGDQWTDEVGLTIARIPVEIDLRFLSLRGVPLGDRGVEELLRCEALENVRSLGVERCGLTDPGVRALARSPRLEHLRELSLCNRDGIRTGPRNDISDDGAVALAASTHLANLETLDLWNNPVGDPGWEAIARSPGLPRLNSAYAWGTRLTAECAKRIQAETFARYLASRETGSPVPHRVFHTDHDERSLSWSDDGRC